MLDIPAYVVQHFVTILAVLCEKKAKPIPEEFEAFCNAFLDLFYPNEDLNWNFQNPTVKNFFIIWDRTQTMQTVKGGGHGNVYICLHRGEVFFCQKYTQVFGPLFSRKKYVFYFCDPLPKVADVIFGRLHNELKREKKSNFKCVCGCTITSKPKINVFWKKNFTPGPLRVLSTRKIKK